LNGRHCEFPPLDEAEVVSPRIRVLSSFARKREPSLC
jgi:hypothetical protein